MANTASPYFDSLMHKYGNRNPKSATSFTLTLPLSGMVVGWPVWHHANTTTDSPVVRAFTYANWALAANGSAATQSA
jgi:hypothetical protein